MQTKLYYTNEGKLENFIRNKNYIPHKIIPGEKLIVGEKYYDGFYNKIYKVLNVEYSDNGLFEGAQVKMDDNTYAWITSQPNIYTDYYITYDIYKIYNINIINNKHIYSGAEIRYWFFINNITVMDKKYACFWPFIDPTNPGSIDDEFTYTISASTDENGNFYNPRIVRIHTKDNNYEVKAREYWDKLAERILSRIKS